MKILIVGDVESNYIWNHFDKKRLKKIDIILSSGDLREEYLNFLVSRTDKPLFYVLGNHDKYSRKSLCGCKNIDGKIIKYNQTKIAGIGGCKKYNKGKNQYREYQMNFRLKLLNMKVLIKKGLDILVTHAPIFGINDGKDLCHQGFKSFFSVINKYKPRYFIHGHNHLNYSQKNKRITIYNKTIIINSFDHYIFDYEKLYLKYFG